MKTASRAGTVMPASVSKTETVISVDPTRVRPFADQPRGYFDKEKLVSLEASIKRRGQLQPGMVTEIDGDREHDYELVDGQRRWHACLAMKIPFRCVVVDPVDIEDQYEISIASNFQRAGHTPLEEARAIERLLTRGGRTQEYVGEIFGRSPFWVSSMRHLVNLVPEIQKLIDPAHTTEKEQMHLTIAINLARLPKERQLPMLEEIRGLNTPRAVDRIRRALVGSGVMTAREKKGRLAIDKQLRSNLGFTIQKTEMLLERLTDGEIAGLVNRLRSKRQLFEVRGEISLAIERLQELSRKLGGGGVGPDLTPVASSNTPSKPESSVSTRHSGNAGGRAENASSGARSVTNENRGKAPAAEPKTVYSHPMTCPRCHATNTRFRRAADADLKTDSWMCCASGCQLKISHVSIRVDTRYNPAATPPPRACKVSRLQRILPQRASHGDPCRTRALRQPAFRFGYRRRQRIKES